jgi:Domain of unknown function (DUF397)
MIGADPMALDDRPAQRRKPSLAQLGIDMTTLEWHRSGSSDGYFEVAFVAGGACGPASASDRATVDWVLLRVAGDPAGRILIYDRVEWASFLDGSRNGEFDPEPIEQALAGSVSDTAEPGRRASERPGHR